MKYLISFFLSLVVLSISAQTPVVPAIRQTVPLLKTYFGPANKIYVISTNSEYVICSPCTTDEVTVFAGAGGRKWKRVIPGSIPQDSIAGLSASFAGKLNTSDSSFFRGVDRNYALSLANARVKYTDTSFYRGVDRAYAAGLVAGKLNASDSSFWRAADRLYANNRALFHIQNFNDTAIANYPISLYPNLGDTIPTRGDAIRRMRDSLWVAVQDSVDYPLDSLLTIGLNIPPTSKIVRSKLDSLVIALQSLNTTKAPVTGAALISATTPTTPATSDSTDKLVNTRHLKQVLALLSLGGGSINWGGIGGLLSNQTDLNAALLAKQAADTDLSEFAAITKVNDNVLQVKGGAYVLRTMAQLKADLALSKSDVGLSNVNDVSDANKPVSTAQAAADLAIDNKNMDTTQNALGAWSKTSSTWSTGTVTVNSNNQRHDILITATGARTLVVSNINAVRSVVMWIDNTSGATIALTLPANSFLQNTTTGIYGSATSVTLAQGKTVLTLSNFDGTNHWFNY